MFGQWAVHLGTDEVRRKRDALFRSRDNECRSVDSISLNRTQGLIDLIEGKYADLRP